MNQSVVQSIQVRSLQNDQPWQWLVHGWNDFKQAPAIGVAHGLAAAAFGLLLFIVAYDHFWFLAGALTGFLVVAPVVAVGLYAVSHALEQNRPATFALVFRTWWSWRGEPHHDWRLVRFGLLLALSGSGWVITSAALITLFAPQPVNQPLDFLRYVVLAPNSLLFETWLALVGALAAPVFASTVVTLPLLLERRIGIFDAVLVSWKVVVQNPVPMAIWAALIMLMALLALLGFVMGCAVVLPVLGHASWHVYRAAVDASALPLRVPE